jgi:hypothetical protein
MAAEHVAVSVTRGGREAMRTLAVLATTASGRKLSMSDAVVAALAVVREHPDDYRAALLADPAE